MLFTGTQGIALKLECDVLLMVVIMSAVLGFSLGGDIGPKSQRISGTSRGRVRTWTRRLTSCRVIRRAKLCVMSLAARGRALTNHRVYIRMVTASRTVKIWAIPPLRKVPMSWLVGHTAAVKRLVALMLVALSLAVAAALGGCRADIQGAPVDVKLFGWRLSSPPPTPQPALSSPPSTPTDTSPVSASALPPRPLVSDEPVPSLK